MEDSVREIPWQTAGKELPSFGDCVLYLPLDRARDRANKLDSKFLNGVYLRLMLGTNEIYISIATDVVRAAAIKRKTEPERSVWDGRSASSSKVPLHCSRRWPGTMASVRRCVRPMQSLHPCRCENREVRNDSSLPRMRRDSGGWLTEVSQYSVQQRKLMTKVQQDQKLARRVQAAEGRMRPRAIPDDERDAVRRPSAKRERRSMPYKHLRKEATC